MGTTNKSLGVLSSLSWCWGRLELLTGLVTIGAATALLVVSGKGKGSDQNSEVSMRLVPLILAAFGLLFLTGRHKRVSR